MAVGAGANLALAGDFPIASHTARFQEVFVNLGVGLDTGGTYILPRLVGLVEARELAMLGEVFDGESAYFWNATRGCHSSRCAPLERFGRRSYHNP